MGEEDGDVVVEGGAEDGEFGEEVVDEMGGFVGERERTSSRRRAVPRREPSRQTDSMRESV